MTFPTDPVRSPGWYDNCFQDAGDSLPADLRKLSESICNQFSISGICDPMYIANVAAFELGRGDGCGEFFAADFEAREGFNERVARFVDRIRFSYVTRIQASRDVVLSIVHKALASAPASY